MFQWKISPRHWHSCNHEFSGEKLLTELPPELKQEVQDFAQFLMDKKTNRKQQRLRLSWAGGLKDFRDKYTSLELQKKALDWWGD